MTTEQNKVLSRSSPGLRKRGATISNRLGLGLVTILVVLLLLFGFVSAVAANPPDREPLPFNSFTIPKGPLGCNNFDVQVDSLTNKEMITTFVNQEGNTVVQIITGGLKIRVTNLSTDKSVDLNISGPFKLVPQPDGSLRVITFGPTLWWFSDPGVAPGFPVVALFHGQTVSEFNPNFKFLSAQGRVDDVCALLTAP